MVKYYSLNVTIVFNTLKSNKFSTKKKLVRHESGHFSGWESIVLLL